MSSSSGASSLSGAAGTDGIVPVYNPNNRWQIWNLAEIFTGGVGANKYVPNVGDYVVDTTVDQWYIVASVNLVTLIATLTGLPSENEGAFTATDMLLGVGPGTQADTYRCYLDQSVMPHALAVDARLSVAGTMCASCKIFLGADLDGAGTVISAFYDPSGNLLGNTIPLELVATQGNISVKTVPQCYTTFNLPDNQLVTAVFYSTAGNVVSKRQLLIENTAFISTTDRSVKYVKGISLISPFLSVSDQSLLLYPLNVTLPSLTLLGVVNYSDGSSIQLPVDGTKFQMLGLNDFVSTVVGQKFNLVLKYNLSPNEIVYGATAVNSTTFITQPYKAQTINQDGAYSVKLFGYPVWSPTLNNYSLKWFLYNLDRLLVYDVTALVTINGNVTPFNPVGYGILQNLSVSINLQQVNGSYNAYIFTEIIGIVLNQPGSQETGTAWTVAFAPGQTPPYGVGNVARTTYISENLTTVDVTCGQTTQAAWLTQLYFNSDPLYDPFAETAPPTPNYFAITYSGQRFEFTIDQWATPQTIGVGLIDLDTLFIEFFFRGATNDMQLGISGLPIWQSN